MKNQVRVALDAVRFSESKFENTMFLGPPGLGKSALANAVADELKVGFHEVLGQSMEENFCMDISQTLQIGPDGRPMEPCRTPDATSALVDDGVAAPQVMKKVTVESCPRMELIWGDNKYNNNGFKKRLDEHRPGWRLEIKEGEKGTTGFVPIRKRWEVERTFAHLSRYRRLSKDYEVRLESSEATVILANMAIALRRLAPNPNEPKFNYRTKYHKV